MGMQPSMFSFRVRQLVTLATVSTLAACSGEEKAPTEPTVTAIESFVSGVSADGGAVTAALRRSQAPASTAGPAAFAPPADRRAVQGGSSQFAVNASSSFTRLVVAVAGVGDHFELLFPSATTSASLILTISANARSGDLPIRIAAGTASGVGSYMDVPVHVLDVGTGDVQVSVSWDAASDVDLYLVEPGGAEIYYGNERSMSGGELDLDSNAGCAIDNVNNENITWPSSQPPRGTYAVRVNYYDECGVARTNWVVTVRNGSSVRTFTGTFTGNGNGGASGAGQVVTTFTR